MWLFNDWHDYWRLLIIAMTLSAIWLLVRRYHVYNEMWNVKTRDFWYSLLMWCFAGLVGVIQAIILDYPRGVLLPVISAAAIVTLRGLLRKGEWGSRDS